MTDPTLHPPRQLSRIVHPSNPIFLPSAQRSPAGRARRWMRRLALLFAALVLLVAIVPRATTWVLARGDVAHGPGDLSVLEPNERRAAIVLGAGLVDKRPSPLLSDRVEASVELLDEERVDLLLMSGDNTTQYYDEPSAMRRSAIEQGAPADQVAVDYAGRRTWDTCVRAHDVFGVREAVVVTSAFHVDRAVAACRAAGIDVTGYSVDDSRFGVGTRIRWRARELAATGRALVDVWWLRPKPAVGGDEIDPWEPCQLFDSLAPSVRDDAREAFRRHGC